MRALWERAERTPASRERYVDLLRAVAVGAVVLGHWLISGIRYDEHGRPTGSSALESLPWAFPITWVVQVMPLFFIIGGYANAASLASHRARGGDAVAWLLDRTGRLVRPTTTLLLVLAGGAALARVSHVDPEFTRMAVWVASIPLWFLSAYLVVVAAAPLMYRLHQRFGWRVPAVLVALVALGDVARLSGKEILGAGSFLFGWLAIHQVGFAWRDGALRFRARTWAPLLFGGLVALVALTVAGPYPISMIDVSGERLHNASPPTLALLAAAAFQLGLVMSVRDRAERWLRRGRPWRAVVAMNSVVFTVFLWHMSAVVLLVGLLHALRLLPTPPVATAAWWLWRLPWLLMLAVVLAVLVAVFGRLEMRPSRSRGAGLLPALLRGTAAPLPRLLLTAAAFAAVIAGLVSNNLAPRTGEYLVGIPGAGLVAYLAGASVLRLLRSPPARTTRVAPATP
jgi:hypothetical protein